MMMFKKNKQNKNNEQQFEIINRYIKGDGRNQSIQEDSLIAGFIKITLLLKTVISVEV